MQIYKKYLELVLKNLPTRKYPIPDEFTNDLSNPEMNNNAKHKLCQETEEEGTILKSFYKVNSHDTEFRQR